jgi:competence protein ComEC
MHRFARLRAGCALIAASAVAACDRPAAVDGGSRERAGSLTLRPDSALVVRVLDVGQGDATLVTNGTSTVLIDGGPDPRRLGRLLDSLGYRGRTIDAVVLTHQHFDHHSGLRALFETRRRIRVRYFFENKDPYPNEVLAQLRDSVSARVDRGELVWRDTDDPCSDGRPVCILTMTGGARIEILRPMPARSRRPEPNDRSTVVKLVGPDSASFTMWLGADAERGAIRWFDRTGYDERPGMRADVLKAGHHGSCDGVTRRYLALIAPDWVIVSLAAHNEYGHIHQQAKATYTAAGIPWYRTDQNGTITIRSPGTRGGGYTITPQRGSRSANGPSDRRSTQPDCRTW